MDKKRVRLLVDILHNYRIKKNQKLSTDIEMLLESNAIYKGAFKGKRCFIFGNGPSLNHVDFESFSNEVVFTVNQLSRNSEFYKLKTNFHFWADSRFFDIDDSKPEDRELLDTMKSVNTPGNRPVVFYDYTARSMVQKYNLEDILNIHYFAVLHYRFKAFTNRKKIDITKAMPDNPTVIHTAIAMAVDMGFSEIYLLGCDCTGFVNMPNARMNLAQKAEYNYSISNNEKKRMEKVALQTSVRDELMSYVNLFDRYALMKEYCDNYGVKLFNATDNSLLDSIPKVKLEKIMLK